MRGPTRPPEDFPATPGSPGEAHPEPLRRPYVGSLSLSNNSDLSLKDVGEISLEGMLDNE